MAVSVKFIYPSRGKGRPQILLLGNGLERKSGQVSWNQLLDQVAVENSLTITKKQRDNIPFPLLYQLLVTHMPAPAHLSLEDIREEESRLKDAMQKMRHESNDLLNLLPSLEADHIMTTNYSYCVEKAFFPNSDFSKSYIRDHRRFHLKAVQNGACFRREINYKLHTGYLAKSCARNTGLWHIHGECSATGGIVLGHDRYGRLLRRVEEICNVQRYSGRPDEIVEREFNSWPELFLYGDIYILGLTLGESEFDLWWLLRRKQRERYADGSVYYYERRPYGGFQETRHLLLQATGVKICDVGSSYLDKYDSFYIAAFRDIQEKIAKSRS